MRNKLNRILARLFGHYCEYEDSGYKWKGYHWRGCTYMTEWSGPRR